VLRGAWVVAIALPLPCLPVAIAVAVLRYRLWDLDRLVSRTVTYGLLTLVLGLGYAGVVLVLGQLFGDLSGRPPSWAVAAATLAGAALLSTGGSTAAAMTPRGSWTASPGGSGTRSTWTPSTRSCWPWSTGRCSPPGPPCGCARPARPRRRSARRS
jgi:hypothetical protein